MSLWNKPPSEITFADIDAFCKTMRPEGPRLDYKGIAFPNDLSKTIAAFANTLGGLILLGVDADKKSNMPIWPPVAGMPMAQGLSERVYQLAQEAIYPPVRVGVSNVIENALHRGSALVLIRVDESREAPHAIEKNRRVYVYERTDNKNEPYELANIGRIEHLLKRRQRLVDQREEDLHNNLARAARQMRRSNCPIRWISASPVYPWQNIHDPYDCVGFHQHTHFHLWSGAHWSYQKIPGGSFAIGRAQSVNGHPVCTCVSSVSANGTLFAITYGQEATSDNHTILTEDEDTSAGKMWMNLANIRAMTGPFVDACNTSYGQTTNRPGEVMISIGLKNAHGLLMHDDATGRKSNAGFLDAEFRIDRIIDTENILGKRMESFSSMFNEISFAFNADAIQR